MAVLCGMPTIQYSAESGPLSVHKLSTSCIRHSTMPSVKCRRYLPYYLYSVSNSVCFSSMSVSQAAQYLV